MKLKIGILGLDIVLYKSCDFYSGQIRTLVAMATYCFHRLIMGKVEIGNFYCFFVDNRFTHDNLMNFYCVLFCSTVIFVSIFIMYIFHAVPSLL